MNFLNILPGDLAASIPKPVSPEPPASVSKQSPDQVKGAGQSAPAKPSKASDASDAKSSPDPQHPEEKKLQNAIKQINDALLENSRTLQFSVDKDTGRTIVQIRDNATNEVIRQIPSEETLKLAKNLDKDGARLLNEKA